ncbi:D-2-hydroxyacid dehydrogenase family protein [Arachidicoccus ginsenosidivorans]|jgi:D-3-phosphoglycerate dehydrogenase|uniref:D-2-hydroxyacid dehydrogenase family protein n=1 Tax=Arachidicoccus ginsenosidivorans TaxID=496057 RepID=A0A5B8VPL0_9BACT|nr:D-2-hydroxyacid dehydrogenase family protein [Arachidicoccus ginsenosidivorans]QEC72822.1 D-2-hydroxyacid dehydrogenase family protein [Arachidicoccus ginsenosidivorans]
MKISILDDYQNVIKDLTCFKLLQGQDISILHKSLKDPVELAAHLSDTEVLVLTRERTQVNEALLSLLPNLKLISQTGKISNHLNLADCTKYGVAVAEGVGSPVAPAELTWALLLNTVRKIPQAIEGMKNGDWQINMGDSIYGKTIGIWGYGKIGQKIAQYAKVFGATVLVWGSENSRQKALEDGFNAAASKAAFFELSDIVTLHLRLNKSTNGIVKPEDLMMLKQGATLINTSRAELIEAGALLEVLNSGKQINVGTDVYDEEPIFDKDYPLLAFDNVVCTPHIGYVERNGYELYFGKAFENALNYINGSPTLIANPEVL